MHCGLGRNESGSSDAAEADIDAGGFVQSNHHRPDR